MPVIVPINPDKELAKKTFFGLAIILNFLALKKTAISKMIANIIKKLSLPNVKSKTGREISEPKILPVKDIIKSFV